MSAILAAALAYAVDYAVFPVPPGEKRSYKSARHCNGRKWGATSDPGEITADFTRWPNAGIGIPTGSANGIVVVEIDTVQGHSVDGAASLQELEAKHSPLPATRQATSPSGSVHRYFKHPGGKIRNSTSEIGAGIDVRGDGGMIIAPPTVRPAGTYRWLNNDPIVAMPGWLIELTREKPRPAPSLRDRLQAAAQCANRIRAIVDGGNAYGAAALRYELDNIHQAQPGHRNATLNKAGFSLGQLVAIGLLDETEVAQLLFDAASVWGNPKKDREVIRYAMEAGMQHPRVLR